MTRMMTRGALEEYQQIEARIRRGELSGEDVVELVATDPKFKLWWDWRRSTRRRKVEGIK